MARPVKHQQARRTLRFLELAAAGVPLDKAAEQAQVDPRRALRMVSDRDQFEQAVKAVAR